MKDNGFKHATFSIADGALEAALESSESCAFNDGKYGVKNYKLYVPCCFPSILSHWQDPYYLHPNESPSLVLVSPLMNGKNYHAWSRAMKVALISKNKLVFVNGTITAPTEDDAIFPAWERYLQEDLFQTNQGDRSVSDYFTILKALWDELNNLRPPPPCTCGSLVQIREHRETDQVIRFLRGLNESFAQVRSQIMLMSPLPNINKAFSLVQQQERQLRTDSHIDIEAKVFAGSSKSSRGHGSSYRGRGRFIGGRGSIAGNKYCTNCKKTNHTIDTCYFKHGFPQGYRTKNFQGSSNAAQTEQNTNTVVKDNDVSTPQVSVSREKYEDYMAYMQ
ncbi:uncharacterized protein LOC133318537 [Gastrolobium bilobum]|uniref:uncharacterized protein LOC133318537 n=1 Tax=Gastrolobium bilobum TaxID=150636 RepID=UPI002AB1355D|nr:uncharacterized protein LOC133318537 [Gastrolobium bilobum]